MMASSDDSTIAARREWDCIHALFFSNFAEADDDLIDRSGFVGDGRRADRDIGQRACPFQADSQLVVAHKIAAECACDRPLVLREQFALARESVDCLPDGVE